MLARFLRWWRGTPAGVPCPEPQFEYLRVRVLFEDDPVEPGWEMVRLFPLEAGRAGPLCRYDGALGGCSACTGGVENCRDPVSVWRREVKSKELLPEL